MGSSTQLLFYSVVGSQPFSIIVTRNLIVLVCALAVATSSMQTLLGNWLHLVHMAVSV